LSEPGPLTRALLFSLAFGGANRLLEHLKALRNERREFRNEFHSETENLKQRMSTLETAMINVKREVNAGDETDARHQVQIDQLVERIRRIEKRLDLT
jgi:chromosome segregation ATPase